MSDLLALDLPGRIAQRMRAAHADIAARWLARLIDVVPVGEADVFPGQRLLDHIPELVRQIAGYLSAPEAEAIAANTAVIAKAQELGQLRHAQEASVHQVVLEYRILGEILTTFVADEIAAMSPAPGGVACVQVMHRLNQSVGVLMQTTVDQFIAEYTATIQEQTGRLENFNRMASHELRQPLATIQFAVATLGMDGVDDATRHQLRLAIQRSVRVMGNLVSTLERMSRLCSDDGPHQQRVEVSAVASEAARQLGEMAASRDVALTVEEGLPSIVVDTARLELVLVNLLSNGIKYSDPSKTARHVTIAPVATPDDRDCGICVRDNGLGIPARHLTHVFTRSFRSHADRDRELGVDGLGLGLAIVGDCVRAMNGHIEVTSSEGEGTTFTLTLPVEPQRDAGHAPPMPPRT